MRKVLCVIGTRPEAIKMAPVIRALKNSNSFTTKVLATGQHTDMLKQALEDFGIAPDFNLNIMRNAQTLDHITSSVLAKTGDYLDSEQNDFVLVHGDTSTTFAASLAAFYRKIPVAHVEAGLRSHDKYLPFPEEMNRVLTDRISEIFFAPTENAAENLRNEHVNPEKIFVTGNTVIDALFEILKLNQNIPEFMRELDNQPFVLMTAHRRESWGEPLLEICAAVRDILAARPDVKFLIPLHKNPIVRDVIKSELQNNISNVIFTEPLNYPDFTFAMSKCRFILSDSGGVQEEASAINKPVLIMRTLSERPEAIDHGTGVLVGTNRKIIRETTLEILNNESFLKKILSKNTKPFGNGTASQKILSVLENYHARQA